MMNHRCRRRAALCPAALVYLLAGAAASAEVTNVTGEVRTRVEQFFKGVTVQSDYSQELVPGTSDTLPALARARLAHLNDANVVTAAGQSVAALFEPNLSGTGDPNDIDLSIAAFSDDPNTSWMAEGNGTTTRTITISLGDVQGQTGLGDSGRARSRFMLSGALVIFSENPSADLTGNEISFSFSATFRQSGRDTTVPLAGDIWVVGGPDGTVDIKRQAGALSTVNLPIADFPVGDQFPLVRAVLFQGIQLPYEYDMTLDTPFELQLDTAAKIVVTPGGIGAWAVFGMPQDEIADLISRVKKNDAGQRLVQTISDHVDTTGERYSSAPASLSPACGVMGFEAVGLVGFAGALAAIPFGRRRRS